MDRKAAECLHCNPKESRKKPKGITEIQTNAFIYIGTSQSVKLSAPDLFSIGLGRGCRQTPGDQYGGARRGVGRPYLLLDCPLGDATHLPIRLHRHCNAPRATGRQRKEGRGGQAPCRRLPLRPLVLLPEVEPPADQPEPKGREEAAVPMATPLNPLPKR